MNFLHRLFGRTETNPEAVVPANPEHQRVLRRADALLAAPQVKALLNRREKMRDSFSHAGQRIDNR